MNEVTFLDALDYCEVHGHIIDETEVEVLVITGTQLQTETCVNCDKKRKMVIFSSYPETYYPSGEWE